MRHELPSLRGAFTPPSFERPAGPPFGPGFIIVGALLAVTIVVCVVRVLLG